MTRLQMANGEWQMANGERCRKLCHVVATGCGSSQADKRQQSCELKQLENGTKDWELGTKNWGLGSL